MRPKNELLLSGEGYVFVKADDTYLVYLPAGDAFNLDLSGNDNAYKAEWFNPRNGVIQTLGYVFGGNPHPFSTPDSQDWVLLLEVEELSPPQILSAPPTGGTVGELYQYEVSASGVPMPTFNLITSPEGMTINPTSGLIEWLPASDGEFEVKIQADSIAGSDSQQFTLIIELPPIPTIEPTGEPEPTKLPPPESTNFVFMPVAQK